MILYTYFRSSAAYRARIALHLKGMDYEAFLKSKGGWAINARWFLVGPVAGIAVMVGVGAIK